MNSLKYILSLTVIIALVIACSKDNQQTNKQNQTQPPKDTSKPEPKTQYRDIEYFEDDKSQLIDLRDGRATLDILFEGTGNFKATINDSLGNYIATLIETTGPYKGQKLYESPKTGMFILDVKCKGRWYIKRK